MDIAAPDRTLDGSSLRAALGRFATGVTVVTTGAADPARLFGTTASAVSSLSLDPPLVLVCLRNESETLAAILRERRFAVNVLAADQRDLAERFARRRTPGTWEGVAHREGQLRVPVLDRALSAVECSLHRVADGGDHRIVVGRVRAIDLPPEPRAALVHHAAAYAQIAAAAPRAVAAQLGVRLPSRIGDLRVVAVDHGARPATTMLVLVGDPRGAARPLVYLHRACVLGDALGGLDCPRRADLHAALARIAGHGAGVVVYHRDDARPFGDCCVPGGGGGPAATALGPVRAALGDLDLGPVGLLAGGDREAEAAAAALGLDVVETLVLDGAPDPAVAS